jgi:hypothetical protein
MDTFYQEDFRKYNTTVLTAKKAAKDAQQAAKDAQQAAKDAQEILNAAKTLISLRNTSSGRTRRRK